MNYVPGFEWDVFISYARTDDKVALSGQRGWVSSFVDSLNVAVTALLGEDIKLFFDRPAAGAGNGNLEDMKIAAGSAAIFVVIASPTYPKREWPMTELNCFNAQCDDPHRLFVAERLPLDKEDSCPEILAKKNHREFWSRLIDYEAVEPMEPESPRFKACMADFAFKMQRHLRAMRPQRTILTDPMATAPRMETAHPMETEPVVEVTLTEPGPVPPPPKPLRTVLIAQPTDDVAYESDKVHRYLEQYSDEIRVLPTGAYPQGGEEFKRRYGEDLAAADIVVQLLGASAGIVPPDLPGGYTRFQLEAARAAGKTILQWRHAERDLASIADEAHRALLSNPYVTDSGLEEFKADILRHARKTDDPEQPPEPEPGRGATRVFVNADRDNLATARGVAALFSAERYEPFLPMFDGSVKDNRTYLNRMISECSVLFVVNGDDPPIWWTTQNNLFRNLRDAGRAKPKERAVCSVPPAEQPETIDDQFEHIDCTDGWNPGRVRAYIKTLKTRTPPAPEPELEA